VILAGMDATDSAQAASAVFAAAAFLAALLTVRNAREQNRTARESVAAQLAAGERAEVSRMTAPTSAHCPRPAAGATSAIALALGSAMPPRARAS
jgi:hypothetical protein